MERDKEVCVHGIEGGCEVTCKNCGHTCRRHIKGHCDHGLGYPDWCGCEEYEGTEG
jgi:hypothetical protein